MVPRGTITAPSPAEVLVQDIRQDIWTALEREFRPLNDVYETPPWTTAVKTALASLRPLLVEKLGIADVRLRAFHNARGLSEPTSGEHMLDFFWTTWPREFVFGDDVAAEHSYENILAVESEWGSDEKRGENYSRVLHDFRKVVDTKARFKLMVYGCHMKGRAPRIDALKAAFVRVLTRHRHADPSERWLFVGVPWDLTWPPEVDVFDPKTKTLGAPSWFEPGETIP